MVGKSWEDQQMPCPPEGEGEYGGAEGIAKWNLFLE